MTLAEITNPGELHLQPSNTNVMVLEDLRKHLKIKHSPSVLGRRAVLLSKLR